MRKYTRKIDREYNEILTKNASTSYVGGDVSIDVDPNDVQKANDHLVKELFELSDEDLDNMDMKEYSEKLKQVMEVKGFLGENNS